MVQPKVFSYAGNPYVGNSYQSNNQSSMNSISPIIQSTKQFKQSIPRTSILQSAQQFKNSGLVPQYAPIQGLDSSYYDNLQNQAEQRLRKQYFNNPNSILAQRENSIKQRGLFGSGIGEQATNEVYKGFGEELAGVQSEIAKQQAENKYDVAKFNKQNQLDTTQLLLGAAGDEARAATDFDTGIFEALANIRKGEDDKTSRILETLSGTLGQELIDPDTRQFFESLFGTTAGNQLGYGYNQFLQNYK